jgi:hypothetical protein
MATTIGASTLTVTITEALTMTHSASSNADDRTHSQTITQTFSNIDNLEKRLLNLPNTTQVELITLGATAAAAPNTFKRSSVAYIRITVLDDSDGVVVGLEDTGADTAYIHVYPGSSLLLNGTQVEVATNGAAWSAWSNVDQIFVKANAANTTIEVVVATTE